MNRTLIKICGIHSVKEAGIAAGAGADLLGVLVVEGAHSLTPAKAEMLREIRDRYPRIGTVAVTRCTDLDSLLAFAGSGLFSHIQIQSSPDLALLQKVRDKTTCRIIAVVAEGAWRGSDARGVRAAADFLLVDAAYRGATGRRIPLEELEAISAWWGSPETMLVAGGLSPVNVRQVIDRVHPGGVDVLSGVRGASGELDRKLVMDFVGAAR